MSTKKAPRKDYKDGEINKLRNTIDKQKKEIARLKRELRNLENGVDVSRDFLKGTVEGIEMDKLIDAAKKGKGLKEIKDEEVENNACPVCFNGLVIINTPTVGKVVVCNKCNYRGTIKE